MSNKEETETALPNVKRETKSCCTSRPRTTASALSYTAANRGLTSRSFCSHSSRRPRTPYEEVPKFMTLIHGKTMPPKTKEQVLKPTTNFGHIPTGTMQAPVVVVKSRDVPEKVEYRERAKHTEKFDNNFEQFWNEKYKRKNKYSPYKDGMSELRKSAVIKTSKILKETEIESSRERKSEVIEYQKTVAREYEIEKSYPKGDLIHNRQKYLRIILTE